MKARYSVIVPMFNEEQVISHTYERLKKVMDECGDTYELVFVNDGSRDRSAQMIREICERDEHVKLIDFSRNFGHQVAITAAWTMPKVKRLLLLTLIFRILRRSFCK